MKDEERALLHCLDGDRTLLDHVAAPVRRRLETALEDGDVDTPRSSSRDRLRARDRVAAQRMRSALPPHWRAALDRVMSGSDHPADPWIASAILDRLPESGDAVPELEFALPLDGFSRFVRNIGVAALGLVNEQMDRRSRARMLRALGPDERALLRRPTIDPTPELVKLASDAFVRLAGAGTPPSECADDLGLFMLVFCLADERFASELRSVGAAIGEERAAQFAEYLAAARASSRRHLAPEVRQFIGELP